MADSKKYRVKILGAGPHVQGDIITREDCGPDGVFFDKWMKEGALEEYKGDAETTAELQAENSSPELTTGDQMQAEKEWQRENAPDIPTEVGPATVEVPEGVEAREVKAPEPKPARKDGK